jgi:hypothetical protein
LVIRQRRHRGRELCDLLHHLRPVATPVVAFSFAVSMRDQPSPRRPFQFRLRTLLDVVTIVALFASAWRISAATNAPILVEWFLAAGFSVLWLVTRRIVPAPVKDDND